MKKYLHTFTLLLLAFSAFAQTMNTQKIAEKCMPGVVFIEVGNEFSGRLGSGFLISDKGHFVTNYHVIEGNYNTIKIHFKGEESKKYKAIVVGVDRDKDLALLKVQGLDLSKRCILPVILNEEATQGSQVAALGHPKGQKFTLTDGIISSDLPFEDAPFITQTNVALNPGNSGGPLVNKNGQVVAVVVAGLEDLKT